MDTAPSSPERWSYKCVYTLTRYCLKLYTLTVYSTRPLSTRYCLKLYTLTIYREFGQSELKP